MCSSANSPVPISKAKRVVKNRPFPKHSWCYLWTEERGRARPGKLWAAAFADVSSAISSFLVIPTIFLPPVEQYANVKLYTA